MTRRMACSLTVDAVRRREKTVTRRDPATWATLKAGDRLTLVVKAMGLRKGERQEVLADVEIVSNRVEPLNAITEADVVREGVGRGWTRALFIRWWLEQHHIDRDLITRPVRRIEWRYLT